MKIIPDPIILLKYLLNQRYEDIPRDQIETYIMLSYDYRLENESHRLLLKLKINYITKDTKEILMKYRSKSNLTFEIKDLKDDVICVEKHLRQYYKHASSFLKEFSPIILEESEQNVLVNNDTNSTARNVMKMLKNHQIY